MKTALLIIDMQNDFVLPGRPLCVDGALPSVSNIRKLLDFARSSSWTVIHVIREHDKNGINVDKPRRYLFQDGGAGYCVSGTEGCQIGQVVISGTQYPNCIRGTAADAMSFDYDVTVVTDCCSAKTQEVAEANILDMKNMGIKCIPLEEL